MHGDNCGTCMYWWLWNEKDESGICRRYPPVIISSAVDAIAKSKLKDDVCSAYQQTDAACQPITFSDDWCGEWKKYWRESDAAKQVE